jgi:hypothetical protein
VLLFFLRCSKPELEKSFVAKATAVQLLFMESFNSMSTVLLFFFSALQQA